MSRTSNRAYRKSPRSLARAGGATKAEDSTPARRQAYLAGEVVVPEGYGVCTACYRVKRVRASDGNLFSHNHCPGATARTSTLPDGTPVYT